MAKAFFARLGPDMQAARRETLTDPHQFHRHLRLFDATTLVVGSMIGSAIFFALSINNNPARGSRTRGAA